MNEYKYQKYELGKFIKIKHGYAFKSNYFFESGKYIVLTPGNFFESGGFRERPGKDRFYIGEIPKDFILDKNDLIVAMTEQGEGLLGSAALIPSSDKYLHNQRLGLISFKLKSNLEKKYLYYLFNTNLVRQQIRGSSSGTKVRHTSPERIYKVQIEIPNFDVQQKIAAILSAYDDLIENNNCRIAILEKMAEEIYREWFVRLRFPGHEQVKFNKGIPEGWEIKTVEQLVRDKIIEKPLDGNHGEIHPKGDDFVASGIPFIMASNIKDGYIDLESCNFIKQEQADSLRKGFAREGDVLLSHKATIGRTAIVGKLNTPYLILSPQVTYYRIKNHKILNNKYLKYFFEQLFYQELLNLWAGSGGTRPYIGITAQLKLPILVPSPLVIEKFHSQVSCLFDAKNALIVKNIKLKQTRDRLLTRLISGKLSVEDLDIQFPPSMTEELE
ncbi:restriction endonuclease subunit S [Anabaena minutissima FACHB-250]|nr:restriction endonuclease subunit S [Anabaena minutissima FACHB-250]